MILNHVIYPKLQVFGDIWQKMHNFTIGRQVDTLDEIWQLEHEPVFTQGQTGSEVNILSELTAPVVYTDRGGQITYHGPGQLILYTLINLSRLHLNIKGFINILESSVIELLHEYDIPAYSKVNAPGVYVRRVQANDLESYVCGQENERVIQENDLEICAQDAKICSIGLRCKRNSVYHGLSLNIQVDLSNFDCINPCGYSGLQMVNFKDFVNEVDNIDISISIIGCKLVAILANKLQYQNIIKTIKN